MARLLWPRARAPPLHPLAATSQLGPQGVCLLLGLAVVVTLEANVCKAAALFLADYDKRAVAAARAERAAAARASAA